MMRCQWNEMEWKRKVTYQKLVHEEWSGLRGRVAGVVTGRAAIRLPRIVAAAARSIIYRLRRRSHILDAQRQDKIGQETTGKGGGERMWISSM
jgi:hypothetical protein